MESQASTLRIKRLSQQQHDLLQIALRHGGFLSNSDALTYVVGIETLGDTHAAQVSISGAIKNLVARGFLVRLYRGVTKLTPEGKQFAIQEKAKRSGLKSEPQAIDQP